MASFPRKPKKGQKALQSIYNSLIQIIDYLPSLQVKGDNKTISVNHSNGGTTIHAINQTKNTKQKLAKKFVKHQKQAYESLGQFFHFSKSQLPYLKHNNDYDNDENNNNTNSFLMGLL